MSTLFFAPAFTFLLQLLASGGAGEPVALLLGLAVAVLSTVALAELFAKAGQPAWAALVPFYDLVILLRIVRRPWWWLLLLLVPLANIVVFLLLCLRLARAFGRGALFGLGLLALAPVCQLILAYGSAEYVAAEADRLPGLALAR